MKSKNENLELTIGLQKEEIKLYLTIIKEIFNALNSIRIYSIKEILTILSKDTNNADNQKIKKEIGLIEGIFDEICLLLKAKERENIKKNIIDFKYSIMEYEYYQDMQEMELLDMYNDKYFEEYEKYEEERNKSFFKKHNNFRSVFDECYEDKNLDKDMEILKNYLEKNNMLSTILSVSCHDLVVLRAKLAVARNKSKIGKLVIPKAENKYKTDKDYSRYEIIGVNPAYVKSNLSKRKLPTEIFTYLISNNILTAKDFKKYSINQFGRTFETKMGDIILDNELPEALDRQKRYNKVDFSQYPKSDFKGTLYISNQWDKNSIDKLITNIESNYGQHISIITPEVANVVAYAYDEDISAVDKYNNSEMDQINNFF